MNQPNVLGVYTARFAFLEKPHAKIRPVIVVSQPQSQHNIIAVVPISSKEHRETIDVQLAEWQQAGLRKPSVARVHRITTMLQADLVAELGTLQANDARNVRTALRKLLTLS